MTAFIQPLDAGIIHCFKAHYHALFCQCALDLDTIVEDNIFKINICEAMLMAKEAWDAVQPMTIKSCWDHTGIQHDLIMPHIPARHESGHGINEALLGANGGLNIIAALCTLAIKVHLLF